MKRKDDKQQNFKRTGHVQRFEIHAELNKDILGDGQIIKFGLILMTASTTDLFTKHLAGAEGGCYDEVV